MGSATSVDVTTVLGVRVASVVGPSNVAVSGAETAFDTSGRV
jgi:hypothetical protein